MWQAVLAQLQFHISKANFATWLQGTSIAEMKDGKVIIGTPNNFSKEWIQSKYHKLINKILHSLDKEVKEVKYTVATSGLKTQKLHDEIDKGEMLELQPRFPELTSDKNTGLNSRYRLENFVVGPFNELAHAAALAVIKSPGHNYNPLFVYGGVGLGKTHLLQAIGNEIAQKETPWRTIRYVSSEKLVSQVVNGIKNRTIEKLKAAYLPVDVLIVDDVQFFAGKEKSQEEFFHIFNALYGQNKQIILSSDRPPKAIPSLEDRLRSRFEGGMIADIGYPDFETRIAILKTKAREKMVHLPEDVFEFIASYFPKNIRELEGALNRLIAFQELNKKTPDLQITKTLLKNIIANPLKRINYKKIIQAVAEFYDLKEEDLLKVSRKKEIVQPRQIAMYLLREELKCSYPFIGEKFGGKDHTTIIYACTKISKEIQRNEKVSEEIELIKQRITS